MRRVNKKTGQATLELAIAFVSLVILLLGSIKVCTWLVYRMSARQRLFQDTRIAATQPGSLGVRVDESKLAPLDIFN